MIHDDTPNFVRACMHNPCEDNAMSDYGRRARRANDAPTVLLQGRVSPRARADVRQAAEASGVTMSYYLEALITKLVEDFGGMPLVDPPARDRANQLDLPEEAATRAA
ncbi:hypothetical protein GCM10022383_29500 [Microbacterium soli]|uniref:Uncharacterized protein n=1 Tax=Microbacterium soli TaxID=446075 RepID=A0ABP7NMQ2_9MICO